MILYHGSNYNFDKLSYKTMGVNTNGGIGFYFSLKKDIATSYGLDGQVITIDFEGQKELSNEKITMKRLEVKTLLKELDKKFNILTDFSDNQNKEKALNEALESTLDWCDSDLEILSSLATVSSKGAVCEIVNKALGYDYCILRETESCQAIVLVFTDEVNIIDKKIYKNKSKSLN